jgi:hypothetical protein
MSGETGEVESGWTVDTLRQHVAEKMSAQNAAWHRLIAEMDLRYQQRYDAQQKALEAALLAQEKAVQTALISAEKAVTKAETAAEKRFESVNEFRSTLADQAAGLMPRSEAETRIAAATEKIVELGERINEVTRRLDRGEGRSGGHADSTKNLITIVGLALTAITVLVGVWLAFGK